MVFERCALHMLNGIEKLNQKGHAPRTSVFVTSE